MESPKLALVALPPGIAVTGSPPREPYCRISGSCAAGTAKRTMIGRTRLIVTRGVEEFA